MPLICKDMVELLDTGNTSSLNHSSLSNYAFLYGVFPTAPSVAIYAVYYNAELEVVSHLHLPSYLKAAIQILYLFSFVLTVCDFLFCFLTGNLWNGDQHFPLCSDNVRVCLVAHDPLDGSSAFDELAGECQL